MICLQGIYYLCGNGEHIIEEERLWPSCGSIGLLGQINSLFLIPLSFTPASFGALFSACIDGLLWPPKRPYVCMFSLCCNLSLQGKGKSSRNSLYTECLNGKKVVFFLSARSFCDYIIHSGWQKEGRLCSQLVVCNEWLWYMLLP